MTAISVYAKRSNRKKHTLYQFIKYGYILNLGIIASIKGKIQNDDTKEEVVFSSGMKYSNLSIVIIKNIQSNPILQILNVIQKRNTNFMVMKYSEKYLSFAGYYVRN